MKKALLILLLAIVFSESKAQQIALYKSTDSLLNFKNFLAKPGSLNQLYNLNKLNANKIVNNIDHMPMAVLEGDSKMPVKKIGGYYTMPVKKIGSEDVPGDLNGFPMLPTFKTP